MSLTKIQNELHAPKNQRNNFGKYNYRSCEDILEAVKPLLLEHGATLTITDEVKQIGDYIYIEANCRLAKSDEEVNYLYTTSAQAGIEKAGGMALPQAFGSASSYARKYALNAMFLIDDTKDADATNKHEKEAPKPVKVDNLKALCKKNKLDFNDVAKWATAIRKKDITLEANAGALITNWSKLEKDIKNWVSVYKQPNANDLAGDYTPPEKPE